MTTSKWLVRCKCVIYSLSLSPSLSKFRWSSRAVDSAVRNFPRFNHKSLVMCVRICWCRFCCCCSFFFNAHFFRCFLSVSWNQWDVRWNYVLGIMGWYATTFITFTYFNFFVCLNLPYSFNSRSISITRTHTHTHILAYTNTHFARMCTRVFECVCVCLRESLYLVFFSFLTTIVVQYIMHI